ncbi:MAG: AMP-binding protein [Syntrophales bacterium]|jgi:long-chain acyl-CoA synthetase|nr:AMP-binding protein [Syntrophales bacterium]MDY0043893.1 AMP-binding protein [Syntrophales bacterium]
MERIWMKHWPTGVSDTIEYRLGEKPLHEYLQQNAKDFPDKIAFIFYGKELSWKELDDSVKRLANYLKNAGVAKGDRVALFMQNCPQYVIAHFAIQTLGGIVTPCSAMFKEWELEYELNDAGAKILITTDDLYPIAEKIRNKTGLENVVVTNYKDMIPEEPALPLPDELEQEKKNFSDTVQFMTILNEYPPEVPYVEVDVWNDVAMMIYTSGTTGQPKGAMLTYGNALATVASLVQFKQYEADNIQIAVMPIFHIAGNLMGLCTPVYSGSTSVLLTRFDPKTIVEAFAKYRCTTWYSVTPMLLAVMDLPEAKKIDWSCLRFTTCTSFGIPLTEEIAKRWTEFTGGTPVVEGGYGLTETHTGDTMVPENVKWGSNGIPTLETDLKIVDFETGKELGVNEKGEIALRNPGVFKGYWKNPERTAETLRDGWVYTGDIGYVDEEGLLWFQGRVKEMIKCSGYSVFPEDVEMMVVKHPAVAQVAVVGVPDTKRGENVKAFIVLKPEYKGKITEADIIAWSKEKMASYKYPREVEFRDSLPATGAGKVLRRLLKDGHK